jgi:hypothetical protein
LSRKIKYSTALELSNNQKQITALIQKRIDFEIVGGEMIFYFKNNIFTTFVL